MLAIFIKKGTKHACHISFVSDQVCSPYIMLSELFAPFIRNVLPIHRNGVVGNIPNVAH